MNILITGNLFRGYTYNTFHLHHQWVKRATGMAEVLIVAGNLSSHKREHYKSCVLFLRKNFPNIPILVVEGNHDYWDRNNRNFSQYIKLRDRWRGLADVTYLSESPYTTDRLAVFGYDSWYQHYDDVHQNNHSNMPVTDSLRIGNQVYTVDSWLRHREHIQFTKMLKAISQHKNKTIVVVTHFKPSESQIEILSKSADYLVYAHNGEEECSTLDKMAIINPGSRHDDPKSILISV